MCTKGVLIVTFRFPRSISELKNPDIESSYRQALSTSGSVFCRFISITPYPDRFSTSYRNKMQRRAPAIPSDVTTSRFPEENRTT